MNAVFDVANYFIKQAEEGHKPLTPIQLIKLVYIAQGSYLALYDTLLFRSPVVAWKYGPIVLELFYEFKYYKNKPILSYAGQAVVDPDSGKISPSLPQEERVLQLLQCVWERFGHYDGIALSAWTHRPNLAWDITYNRQRGCDRQDPEIDPLLIKADFISLVIPSKNKENDDEDVPNQPEPLLQPSAKIEQRTGAMAIEENTAHAYEIKTKLPRSWNFDIHLVFKMVCLFAILLLISYNTYHLYSVITAQAQLPPADRLGQDIIDSLMEYSLIYNGLLLLLLGSRSGGKDGTGNTIIDGFLSVITFGKFPRSKKQTQQPD